MVLCKQQATSSTRSFDLFLSLCQVHPSTSRRWHDEIEAQGHARIDAPVSGGVKVRNRNAFLFCCWFCVHSWTLDEHLKIPSPREHKTEHWHSWWVARTRQPWKRHNHIWMQWGHEQLHVVALERDQLQSCATTWRWQLKWLASAKRWIWEKV